MMQTDLPLWFAWLLCLTLSFGFSGMEAGVFVLSRLRIRQQMRAGRKSAAVLHGFLQEPERFLLTIFTGNTLANFFALAWLLAALHGALRDRPVWLSAAYAGSALGCYLLFDLLPKSLFRAFPNRLCLALALPMRFLHIVLKPLVRLVEGAATLLLGSGGSRGFLRQSFGSREQLRSVMQETGKGFSAEERVMINRVLDLQSMTVRQLMKPLSLAVTVNLDSSLESVLALCRERRLTRFPVWQVTGGQRRIAGILDLDSVMYRRDLEPTGSVARFVKPAVFLDENLPLETALRRMRRGGQHLAVVVGRGQRETGILALQDVLGQIFGEVRL